MIEHLDYNRFTANTVINKKQYRKVLEEVRVKGYAVDYGEQDADLNCVASQIFNHKNEPIASTCVTGSDSRMPAEDFDRLGAIVSEHSLEISKRFSFDPNINGTSQYYGTSLAGIRGNRAQDSDPGGN